VVVIVAEEVEVIIMATEIIGIETDNKTKFSKI